MFGTVWDGVVMGLVPGEVTTRVAVKQLNDSSADATADFKAEIKIMQGLSGAKHVVQLLGVCTVSEPMLMLIELMPRGDLKTVLQPAVRPLAASVQLIVSPSDAPSRAV